MNWILNFSINLAKLLLVCGLFLLSVVAIPLVTCIFLLGMGLGYLREIEPHTLRKNSIALRLPQLSANLFYQCTSALVRIPQARIHGNKSKF